VYDPVATAFIAAKIDKHSWEICMQLHVMHTVTWICVVQKLHGSTLLS